MDQPQIQQLLKQSQQGNKQAFGKLVSEYQLFVFRLAAKLICQPEEAEDITQEVFIRAWTHLPQFNLQIKFSTWLYKITANLCFDLLRQKRRRPQLVTTLQEQDALSKIPVDEHLTTDLNNQELLKKIIQLTAHLTPKQKLVFTLWDLEEMDPEEIKVITGMNSAKIKSNLYLARKYIREKISKF